MKQNFDEKGKIFTAVVTKKPISVVLQTSLTRIEGKIFVRPDERIKDELDRPESFLAVTDARIYALNGQLMAEAAFMAVNRTHIVWILPVESPAE